MIFTAVFSFESCSTRKAQINKWERFDLLETQSSGKPCLQEKGGWIKSIVGGEGPFTRETIR